MVSISFTMFKEKLIDGSKRTTIRRLDIIKIEQMKKLGIQVYWRLRTKETEKLFDAKLVSVRVIQFDPVGYPIREAVDPDLTKPFPPEGYKTRRIYGVEALARADGFVNADEMALFFRVTYGAHFGRLDTLGIPNYFMLITFERV